KELIDILNPVRLSENAERVNRYKVEPYVIAADVYGRAPHIGHGGWTWYTGSASWDWRIMVGAMLGIAGDGKQVQVNPCVPPEWAVFDIVYRRGKTVYRIAVENPHSVESDVIEVWVNDQRMPDNVIQLANDGAEHRVRIVMGKSS